MGLIEQMDRCADLRGMYGQTFVCKVEHDGQSIVVVMDCGRPCVDVSHPFLAQLLEDEPAQAVKFLSAVTQIARNEERCRLEDLRTEFRARPTITTFDSDEPEYVYLVRAENGLHKIGRSKNLANRIKGLRSSSAVFCELIHSFRSLNSRAAERLLHDRFSASRKQGEWFGLEIADVVWIKGIADFQLDEGVAS